MALKSTIFKVELGVADIDRGYYADHALTLARHPSETDARMMLRLVAFARHADPALAFGKGVSDTDEPDLWRRELNGDIACWIDLGQPDERRIGKACGRAREVWVYAYGGQATRAWWQPLAPRTARFANLGVVSIAPQTVRDLGELARRTLHVQATVQDGHVLVSTDEGTVAVEPEILREPGE